MKRAPRSSSRWSRWFVVAARSMRGGVATVVALAACAGCATYASDLERAKAHYQGNEFEKSLAILRLLEQDLDSLVPAERAQYAYTRGMTDYRLAGLAPEGGTGAKDPRKMYRAYARHWLGVAAAIEKNNPAALPPDQKTRLQETLTELSREVFGGGEDVPGEPKEGKPGEGPATAAPTATPATPVAGGCKTDADCKGSRICEGGACVAPAK
jgi:hypothetical protein